MKTIEQIRDAFHLIHRVATGQSDRGYMSIPADPERDADLIVAAAIDELETLRAERDALKAQVANLEAELAQGVEACRAHVCLGAQEAKAERDELAATLRGRAEKVEAARALCRDQLDHGQVEADDLAGRILDAMDDVVR